MPLAHVLAWVVGRGGLLGSRAEALLPEEIPGAACWVPDPPAFSWQDPIRLSRELEHATRSFAREVGRGYDGWLALWCAGAGGVGTPAPALAAETLALQHLLAGLGDRLAAAWPSRRGVFLLSSSAGGVYGDNPAIPVTEASRCSPISEYGRNKVRQEQLVLGWSAGHPNMACLVARLSNLYGARSRGLISQLTRGLIHRRPVHIYVPLDTLRDYLFVDDAARHVSRVLASLGEAPAPTSLVKIFAAGQSVSIASILGILARISKRQPRIVCMPHPRQWQQPARLQFRSERALGVDPPLTRSLASGLHMVLQQHLTLFQQGRLPGPESPGMGQVARAATLRRPAESDARTPGSRDT